MKPCSNAKEHINLETFILEDDEIGHKFTELLMRKQKEGVQVNIIYDSVGSINTPESFFKRLRDGGIQVVEFNPLHPLQDKGRWSLIHPDHRKILIVDGRIAIIGGINISSVYTSRLSGRKKAKGEPLPWRDTDVQIEGPAVTEVQKLFLDTWSKQNGPELAEQDYLPGQKEYGSALVRVVGSTPGQDNRNTFIVYVSAIAFAENSIYLTNAYFIPDDQILAAFKDAARRGVDVKIILPSTSDSAMAVHAARYNYAGLLRAGVKIYERRNAVLHAKTAVIDGVWSTVGSTNLDYWSLSSNDEVNAVVLDRDFAAKDGGYVCQGPCPIRPDPPGEMAEKACPAKAQGGVWPFIRPLVMTGGRGLAKTPLARRFIIHALLVVVVLAATLFQPHFVLAAAPLSSSGQALLDRYSALKTKLGKNHFGIPLYLESTEKFSSLHVDMYGIFAYPFDSVRDSLQTPDNWCDINLLLINIKACTSREVADQRLLTLYSGRKYYQSPKDAFKLDLSFHVAAAEKGYLNIELGRGKWPAGYQGSPDQV